jgi:hypothetical protein
MLVAEVRFPVQIYSSFCDPISVLKLKTRKDLPMSTEEMVTFALVEPEGGLKLPRCTLLIGDVGMASTLD